ncbi:unnamed protein product [Plutella xylostella]|uniref:(diamondback moth) hypothetical protein n=1 Tax=Plutella xylostella TaxID=51655 RepID=A0A8S4G1Y4_PLUXY|nr:unnamed protein product [Plutella xylostella]
MTSSFRYMVTAAVRAVPRSARGYHHRPSRRISRRTLRPSPCRRTSSATPGISTNIRHITSSIRSIINNILNITNNIHNINIRISISSTHTSSTTSRIRGTSIHITSRTRGDVA